MPINSFENYYLSWIPEKPTDHTPMYKSIADQLEKAILSFSLAPNVLLPPQRELADYLDVNLSTITKAYKICERKGYIYAVTGKGTFVSPNALLYKDSEEITASKTNLKTIEPFHSSDYIVKDAIKRILERPTFNQLLSYQISDLTDYHKQIAAKYLQGFGVPALADHIIISTGSQNALTIAMLSMFHSGDYIAVDTFTYHHFKMLANYLGVQLYPIDNDECGMIPEQLSSICKRNNIKGIFLMPSCSNPTAIEMPNDRRVELAKVIEKYNLIVLEDDSFRFIANIQTPSFYELLPEQTIYINSTTKSMSPGIRIAYLLYPSAFKAKLINGERATNLHYTCFDAEIISELINTNDYLKIQTINKAEAQKRNELYNSIIGGDTTNINPYSFYRWYDISNKNPAFIETLSQNNIVVMESQLFNAGSKNADHYVRIALSSERDFYALKQALTFISFLKQ